MTDPRPRDGLALSQAARATAIMHGRDYCIPEDVVSNVLPVCAHRSLLAAASDQQDLDARRRHGNDPPHRAAGLGDRADPGVKVRHSVSC